MVESHEQRMTEIYASNTKSDLALQMHSTKEKKYKRIWNGNKDRGSYKNLTSRGNQQEGSLSN